MGLFRTTANSLILLAVGLLFVQQLPMGESMWRSSDTCRRTGEPCMERVCDCSCEHCQHERSEAAGPVIVPCGMDGQLAIIVLTVDRMLPAREPSTRQFADLRCEPETDLEHLSSQLLTSEIFRPPRLRRL